MADELTVEQALAELREMFPEAAFVSAKAHAVYHRSWAHRPQADVQIDDKGFRCESLSEAMQKVREWRERGNLSHDYQSRTNRDH